MTEFSRRDALLLAAAASAVPAFAQAARRKHKPAAAAKLPTVWDLTELYPTDAAWAAERLAIAKALPFLSMHKGKLAISPANLKGALQASSDIARRLGRLSTYANLKADEDLQVAANQERRQTAVALYADYGEAVSWLNPELLNMGAARLKSFFAADRGLAKFQFQVDDVLRLATHTLDGPSEVLLASTAQVIAGAQAVRSQLVLSDIPWPEVALSTGKVRLDNQAYGTARAAPSRADRKLVFDRFFGTYRTYQSSLGSALDTQVRGDIFQARARNFPSALASALSTANIPEGVYRTLIAEANTGLPVLHRYFNLRRRMLKLPDMAYYDIYPPVTALAQSFDLETSRRLTIEAVAPLGPDYVSQITKATAARWEHVHPQKGKRSGAYMDPGAYDVHPYLLLNHSDDYEGLTTYVHEWGHAMHTVLAAKAQPFETANYPIFTAEIASTLNEQLLVEHMLKGAKSGAERLFYLDRLCEMFRGTFYRQTMFAEFELAIHEAAEGGAALSGERLSGMYLALLRKYHGASVTIEPAYATEWAYIPHFYMNFYVYQYATCVAAATAFSQRILFGGITERDGYLAVLKAGGSEYPVELLQRAGVDMTAPTPYRALIARFAETLDEMEKLIS